MGERREKEGEEEKKGWRERKRERGQRAVSYTTRPRNNGLNRSGSGARRKGQK